MVFGRSKKKADKGEKAAKKPKKEKKPKAKKAKAAKPSRKAKPEGVVVKKRPTDIYTVMLMLSLGFVAIACLMLMMELGSYGFSFSNLTPWKS